jgi:hypothetical protein
MRGRPRIEAVLNGYVKLEEGDHHLLSNFIKGCCNDEERLAVLEILGYTAVVDELVKSFDDVHNASIALCRAIETAFQHLDRKNYTSNIKRALLMIDAGHDLTTSIECAAKHGVRFSSRAAKALLNRATEKESVKTLLSDSLEIAF